MRRFILSLATIAAATLMAVGTVHPAAGAPPLSKTLYALRDLYRSVYQYSAPAAPGARDSIPRPEFFQNIVRFYRDSAGVYWAPVLIRVHEDSLESAVAAVKAAGGEHVIRFWSLVSADIPLLQLPAIDRLSSVVSIVPIEMGAGLRSDDLIPRRQTPATDSATSAKKKS
jgi:hypothetical protein